jgi:hypothetical protein
VSNALDTFDSLIRERIAPLMREQGFRKQRNTFWIRGDGTWGVVNFQKSQWNTSDDVSFTINVGVEADVLRADLRREEPPHYATCSIDDRIGALLGRGDTWWELRGPDDLGTVADEVEQALTVCAIPFVKEFPEQRSLLSYWRRVLTERPEPVIWKVRLHKVAQLAELFGDDALAALAAEAVRETNERIRRDRESTRDYGFFGPTPPSRAQ